MQHLASELPQIVGEYAGRLAAGAESILAARPAPGKWSVKEILGHLIDSAQNNIQRFVRTQYETGAVHILYAQDDWVRLQHYQTYPIADLLQLWVLLNRHLSRIWEHMDTTAGALTCDIGHTEPDLLTLEALATDYIRHLQHHLAAIDRQLG